MSRVCSGTYLVSLGFPAEFRFYFKMYSGQKHKESGFSFFPNTQESTFLQKSGAESLFQPSSHRSLCCEEEEDEEEEARRRRRDVLCGQKK